jgi:hypothetical protein
MGCLIAVRAARAIGVETIFRVGCLIAPWVVNGASRTARRQEFAVKAK